MACARLSENKPMAVKESVYAAFVLASAVFFVGIFYYCSSKMNATLYSDIFERLCLNGTSTTNLKLAMDVPSKYVLFVLVLSRPDAADRRNAIRNTWMKNFRENQQDVLVRFSVGTEGLSKNLLADIKHEQHRFGDLLLIKNLTDSYSRLTSKVLMSFVECSDRYNFEYLLKCDDDTFLLLEIIVTELQRRRSKKNLYWGHMFTGAKVQRTGKFAELKYSSNKYLPYASGSAYILSGNLIRQLSQKAEDLTLYHNEDASIGTWIHSYNVERRDDRRFCAFYPGCETISLAFHPVSIKQLFMIQKRFRKLDAC